MFELDSSIKIKYSSLAWVWDKPKNNVWTQARESAEKLELNIKLKLKLKSNFLAWDPKKLHHQMLISPKIK